MIRATLVDYFLYLGKICIMIIIRTLFFFFFLIRNVHDKLLSLRCKLRFLCTAFLLDYTYFFLERLLANLLLVSDDQYKIV